MKGQQEVASELSPEISPTWQLEGPTADWDFLKEVRLCIASSNTAGAAGFSTRFRLRNPANSAVLAVLESVRFVVASPAAIQLLYGVATVDLSIAGGSFVRDHRWRSTSATFRTTCLFSTDNTGDAVNGQVVHRTEVLIDSPEIFKEPFVLNPGDSFDFTTVAQNVRARLTFAWRERQLPALET